MANLFRVCLYSVSVIAIIRLSGKESNLTQPMSNKGLSIDTWGVMRSQPLTPCHAVWVKQGSQSLSTLYLYYIKS